MKWPFQKAESELDLEVRYHLEALADGFEKEGMTRAAAMKRARAEFGGVEKIKDECRDESRWNWLFQIGQDVRFGWRMMRKSWPITAAAVATLALGNGATTAILTLADALLWRSVGVPAPEQLTEILWTTKIRPEGLMRDHREVHSPKTGFVFRISLARTGTRRSAREQRARPKWPHTSMTPRQAPVLRGK